MDILIDTNILLRAFQRDHPMYQPAWNAVKFLRRRGDRICITPQNIVEFWNVATRPLANNGLGMALPEIARHTALLENLFVFLPDNTAVHEEWRKVVLAYSVSGVQVHDARSSPR